MGDAFDKLKADGDPWDGEAKPLIKAPAVPVRRFEPEVWRQYRDRELYFALLETPEAVTVVFCPVEWWDRQRMPYIQAFGLAGPRPLWLHGPPDADGTWTVPMGQYHDLNHVLDDLVTNYRYRHNIAFENYLLAEANGLNPASGTYLDEEP